VAGELLTVALTRRVRLKDTCIDRNSPMSGKTQNVKTGVARRSIENRL